MDDLIQDLRTGLRGLLRRPGFTLMAVVTLGLGIGAAVSMFSVVDGVILRPLPFPGPDRIVQLYTTSAEGSRDSWSGANFIDFQAQSTLYEATAGYRAHSFSLDDGDFPGAHLGACVTNGFFRVFGIEAPLGRILTPEADPPGGAPAVVLSHALWQTLYGGEPGAVGRTLELNGVPYTIVGVMPPTFDIPEGMELWFTSRLRAPDPPFDFGTSVEEVRGADYFNAVGRLKPEVALAQAQQEGSAITARLAEEYPDSNMGEGFEVVPLHEVMVGNVQGALLVLFGAVGFVLLIACANVANLLLVRATARDRETAVRRALGADRGRLVRQLLTESLLLGLIGGAFGLVLALWGTEALLALAATDLPRAGTVSVDGTVLLFTLGISLLSGLFFGLAPVVQSGGGSPAEVLRQGEGRHSGGRRGSRLRSALIVGEIAVSVVLLVGAALMIRTLAAVGSADPGFTARDALTARVFVPANKYPENEQLWQFYGRVLERVRALPGVRSAAGVLSLPINQGIGAELTFIIEGRPTEPGAEPVAGYQSATAGYFESIGLPLLQGRTFTAEDRVGSPLVAVVSKACADAIFPGEDPVGRHISWNDNTEDPDFEWVTIVGVVGNTLHQGLDSEPRSEVYQPFEQNPWPFLTLVIDTAGRPEALTTPLRRAVMEVDPLQPVTHIRTLRDVLHTSLARRRFNMILMSLFAGLALLLAAVGLYGVLSYTVAQRGREIGIRMALGADTMRVVTQFVREGIRLSALGLGIGLVAALALGRLIGGLVHGIPTFDPLSFSGGVVVLAAVALLASWLPARRAARADPMVTLRRE